MNRSNLSLWVGTLIAIVIAVVSLVIASRPVPASEPLGIVGTRFPNGLAVGTTATVTQNKLTIGNSGTALGNVISANCVLGTLGAASIDSSHAASTTKSYDCAVTGVVSGDRVIAQLATSTPPSSAGGDGSWAIIGAKASSTAGYVSVNLWNGGGTRVPSATQVGSSTVVFIVR